MESSLFGLAAYEPTGEAVVRGEGEEDQESEMSPDPLIHSALAQAKSLERHSDLLTRLSLYEHRVNRTLEKAKAELKQLQKERAESRKEGLIKAGEIANLKEALHQPWDPRDDGFEFSAEDVAAWLRRIELNNAALIFRIDGCLPAQPARSDEKGAPNGPAGRQRT
ncbi:MAG TPA: hypothetical protein VIY49_40245 [Bryobacteraceae bacterium]